MTTPPKVSIVVPIYKVEAYLRPCVDSLLAQTLTDIEVILVDDGSPDGCPRICDEYAAGDSRVRVIHKENGGLLRARITGAKVARADYVGFVDGDDFIDPAFYETMLNVALPRRAQMVCASFWMYWNENRKEKFAWPFPGGFFSGRRLEETFYPRWFEDRKTGDIGLVKAVWCKLFDRDLLNAVYARVQPQVNIGEDLITTYAVAALAERIEVLPDTALYYYRQSESSMMGTYWRGFFQNEAAALRSLTEAPCREAAKPWLDEGLKRYRAYMLYDILYNECKPNRTSTARERREIVRAFVNEPAWRDAAALDTLPPNGDTQTSRLMRRLIRDRRPGLMLAALWLKKTKNKWM